MKNTKWNKKENTIHALAPDKLCEKNEYEKRKY